MPRFRGRIRSFTTPFRPPVVLPVTIRLAGRTPALPLQGSPAVSDPPDASVESWNCWIRTCVTLAIITVICLTRVDERNTSDLRVWQSRKEISYENDW